MATIVPGRGFCSTAATTAAAVEATAQLRYAHVSIFNADSTSHTYKIAISTGAISTGQQVYEVTLATKDSWFSPAYALSANDLLLVQQAEVTSATTSTWNTAAEY